MLVSYLTAHKGRGIHLKRCISSVQADMLYSSITDYEHLVYLDGCDPDHVLYESINKKHVQFFYGTHNCGKAYCVNRLIKYARGKYLFFLDSDDWNVMGRTSNQIELLNQAKGSVIGSNFLYCNNTKIFTDSNYPLNNLDIKLEFWRYPFLLYSSMCVRSQELIDKNIFFSEELRGGIDYEFYSRLLQEFFVSNHNEPLVCYRIGNKAGITSKPATRAIQLSVHKSVMANILGLSLVRDAQLIDLLFSIILGHNISREDKLIVDLLSDFIYRIKCGKIAKTYFPNELSKEFVASYFMGLFGFDL